MQIRVPSFMLHFWLFIDRTHILFRNLWLNLEAPGLEDAVKLLVVEVHDLVLSFGLGTCPADEVVVDQVIDAHRKVTHHESLRLIVKPDALVSGEVLAVEGFLG